MTPRPFLAARWSHIIVLTFEAPDELIRRSIPPGVDPDRWNGRTHVSLVALQMLDVRIKGWRIPGFTAHPQVNFPPTSAPPESRASGSSASSCRAG